MLTKFIIILVMFIILAALGSGLIFLVRDAGQSRRTVKALTWRIALSLILFIFLFLAFSFDWISPHGVAHADTIDHYMNIAKNIPQMEMKADQESQAWARSARTVLILTSESIAETLQLANETAKTQGSPLFCLPANTQLSGIIVNELIQQTYRDLSSSQSDKDKMTVSQVALLGISKQYPCPKAVTPSNNITHVEGLP